MTIGSSDFCKGGISLNDVKTRLYGEVKKYDIDNNGRICPDERPDLNEKAFEEWVYSIKSTNNIPDRKAGIDKRFSIGFGFIFPIPGYKLINPFSGLDSDERNIPPHPDDVARGARTSPIKLTDNYSVTNRGGFLLEVGYSVTPNYRLKNRFSFFPEGVAFSHGHENVDVYNKGRYAYPPINRQRYDTGEDAYTFASIGRTLENSLTVEMYPAGSRFFPINVGLTLIAIQHIYGWDRYGATEFYKTEFDYYPGATARIALSVPAVNNDNYTYRFEVIGATFSIGFTNDVPVVMFGVEGMPPLINEFLF